MKQLATIGCALALFALLPLSNALAQGTTASITGQVVDETGESLPGANIIAIHQPTGTQYGTATNPNGRYSILNMRVGGPYTIRASFVGYQSIEETGISLELDEKRSIDFALRPRTEEMDAVEVVARRNEVISKSRTGAATNVSQEQIDQLPTVSRSITDFTRLVPQAQGGGSLAGANDRYNTIQIDGATLDDVFGLGDAVPGSQAGAEPISLDAIQEFNVEIAPYDVRSSGFTGGLVNAVTKSGSNNFEGLLRVRGGSENTTGDFQGRSTGEFSRQTYVGQIGGPIITDKLFFFANAEVKRELSPENTRLGADLSGTDVFRADRNRVESIRSVLEDTYAYDAGGFSPIDQRQNDVKFLAKIDWNISDRHRLTVRNNYVNAIDDSGISRSNNTYSFENRQWVFRSRVNSLTTQLNSTLSDNMFNEARVTYTRIRDERDVQDIAFPDWDMDLGGGRSLVAGIDRFSQANRLDQDLFEFTNDFTYILGDHTLAAGTNNKLYSFSNLFIQDFFGSYTFEPFETPGGDEVTVDQAIANGQPLNYRYSYATQAAGTDRPEAEFSALQLSLYVQDEWQATEDLRLTIGLRGDVPLVPEEPTFNRTAFEAFGRSTSNVATGNVLWSPRIGFNYDQDLLGDDLSTQFRGGVGIFSGDPPYVWISNQFSNSGADLNRIDAQLQALDYTVDPEACRTAIDNGTADSSPACAYDSSRRFVPTDIGNNPTEQPLPTSAPFCEENPNSPRCSALLAPEQTTEINLIADDFKYPQSLRTNFAVDQQLPLGFVATLEGIYSKTLNNITFRNVNIAPPPEGAPRDGQYPIQTSLYGRPFYGTPGPSGTTNRVSGQFTNALLLENSNDGYEYSVTGQLQRRVAEGLSGSFSYTYSRARNVNNGTSSRAISNWQFNENLDVNNPRIGTADFELRHRILGTLNYTLNYAGRFGSTVGLVYEGRSGEPFSWIYDGNANGDTQGGNDLVYVPATETDVFLQSDNWDTMNAFITGNEALDEARGSVIRRNTDTAPWQNLLDVRFAQTIETLRGQRVEFSVDIENFLNLLNDDWGRIRTTSFNAVEAWDFEGYVLPDEVGTELNGRIVTQDDIGKPKVSFDEEVIRETLNGEIFNTSNIFSRWRMRLGIRYIF